MLFRSKSHNDRQKERETGRKKTSESLSGVYAIPTLYHLVFLSMFSKLSGRVNTACGKIRTDGAHRKSSGRVFRCIAGNLKPYLGGAGRLPGSLTVEASLALPLCLGTLLLLMSLIPAATVYESVDSQLCMAVRKAAAYSVAIDGVSRSEVVRLFYEGIADCGMDTSFIRGGKAGILLTLTEDGSNNGILRVEADYRLKIPGFPGKGKGLLFHDEVSSRVWTGIANGSGSSSGSDADGITVYVAENGVVYHKDSGCSYIHNSAVSVPFSAVSGMRNCSGGKYYPCEYCARQGCAAGNVYLTKDGSRWHTSAGCSRLYRAPASLTQEEAGKRGLRPCPKCGN